MAYADFMTAMMALFMVLWITAQDKDILLETSKYFKQPFNALTGRPVGVLPGKDGSGQGDEKNREKASAANLAFLNAMASELNRMLNVNDVSQESPVDVEVTSDGLKVTLYDHSKHPLFDNNSANITPWGKFALQSLAWIIERNGLRVVIDGHAAAGTVMPNKEYGLWDLTADRANMARRLLERYAVSPDKIERVSGYADTRPLPNAPANSQSNQRLTVSLLLN